MTSNICDGMTECSMQGQLLDFGRQHKRAVLVNPDRFLQWKTQALSLFWGSPWESLQSTLPRKFSKLQYIWNRTVNRHRWSRREDEGERVGVSQGTRQKSSRNFGIRLTHFNVGCNKSLSGNCLPKTQLPANS